MKIMGKLKEGIFYIKLQKMPLKQNFLKIANFYIIRKLYQSLWWKDKAFSKYKF